MTDEKPKEGWNWLINSPKWHYFKSDGVSLCGRWIMFSNTFEQGNDNSPDNCAACRKKLQKLKEQAQ